MFEARLAIDVGSRRQCGGPGSDPCLLTGPLTLANYVSRKARQPELNVNTKNALNCIHLHKPSYQRPPFSPPQTASTLLHLLPRRDFLLQHCPHTWFKSTRPPLFFARHYLHPARPRPETNMSERERSERSDTLAAYTNSLLESRNWEVKLKNLRLEIKDLEKEFNQTEENIKALQSVGQIIGEVLKQLDEERCLSPPLLPFIPSRSTCKPLRWWPSSHVV